jgi:hypothetical protein
VKWYVRGCTVCQGDLHDDVETPGHARCLMCGRTYPIPDEVPALAVVGNGDSEEIPIRSHPRLARTA